MEKSRADSRSIDVIGADANNLKGVDVAFPLNKISVVTGVSGSGKSSLLADTLAAEGSRRMRIFLGASQRELEHDEVRAFIGPIPPTILVGQRGFRPSVRTTVGTATGFLNVLRRLFVLASTPYSDSARDKVPPPSPESYSRWIARHYRGHVEVWAAPIRQERTDGTAALKRLGLHGVKQVIIRSETDPPRLRESGRAVNPSEFKGLNPRVAHTIEALIGVLEVHEISQATQLEQLLEIAFPAGNGSVVVSLPGAPQSDLCGPFGPRLDSTKHWVHPDAPDIFFRPTAHLLSFNAPAHEYSGACRACGGTGIGRQLREDKLVTHPERSMSRGAFALWTEKNYKYVNVQHETIEGLRGTRGFSPDVAWSKLPQSARALVLEGGGDELFFDRELRGRKFGTARRFPGFRSVILAKAATGTRVSEQLAPFVEVGPCQECGGSRWSFQARALRVGQVGVAKILAMMFADVEQFVVERGDFARAVPKEAQGLVEALRRHAHSIVSVGLGYLTGDRGMLAVSDGESRRIRLARVLDADERGFCLLFDEPARGLHESDLQRLSDALERLRGRHTVILNEHREGLWNAGDWHVEIGPGAGAAGGQITYAGPHVRLSAANEGLLRTPLPVHAKLRQLTIRGASIHNVRNADCDIPLGRLTCICGVSGSGKSSFLRGVLAPALLDAVGGDASEFAFRQGKWRSAGGTRTITDVVALDQAMPPANRRSLVATFIGVFEDIRKVFGASPAARKDGLSPSDFGVNSGHGRCQVCLGAGQVLDVDLWSVCPACGGARFGHPALSVRVGGVNIQELLDTPMERLTEYAETFRIPERLIAAIRDMGLGYLALGRPIDTLSGGEVQRLRLATRLVAGSTAGSIFFILDEPAIGLHSRDVSRLATALDRLLDDGRNTIVMVEHDLRLIRSADWIVEFGPGSGPDGGQIVFAGPADRLAALKTATGRALADRSPKPNASKRPARPSRGRNEVKAQTQLAGTAALAETLITGEAPPLSNSQGPAEPTVILSERFWFGRDTWEVGGLDLEVPKLLLDLHRPAAEHLFTDLLGKWEKHPDCWLAVQPFLAEMQTWGAELPASLMRGVLSHISKEGLRLVTTKGEPTRADTDIRKLRATGERVSPVNPNREGRTRALRDAFAIGARYVELRDRTGRLRATATDRLLDLDRAVIAPMVPIPTHFSRFDRLGQCPMCKGTRVVTALSDALIIANRNTPPDSDRFLTPEANAVMKGVRHNELRPFLRRLATEGLWNPKASFERLDTDKQTLILFGFWSRPSAGSFLKSPRVDPGEVSSWLRWDGLYRHVLDQVDRSRDAEWARRILDSARPRRCLRCDGTGLQMFATLLRLGDASFADWTRPEDPSRMVRSLRQVDARTPRQQRTVERILLCLTPLAKEDKPRPADIAARCVVAFTTMAVAHENPVK